MKEIYIFASVILVSLISFLGIFFISLQEKFLNRLLVFLVSFACGALLGSAFFHLLPESIETIGEKTFLLTAISFLMFFILEKFLHWRHCHLGHCDEHAFVYLNLLGDSLHNFLDGAIIASAFLTNFSLGLSTTLAVIFHEIPQEIGDFSVLLYGGMKKKKALFFNFLSALTAVLGAVVVLFLAEKISSILFYFIPFAAGGFLYIAGTDLIPELHKKENLKDSISQFLLILTGLLLMWFLKD
ncbi:MAG: ZIP family metal transporter [Microgenomates group bacterium]